jgi:hypothetical protein
MVSVADARKLAMTFPDTVELPHFEKTSFRSGKKKKIFMTIDVKAEIAVLGLTPEDQSVFALDDAIEAVPNKWGLQGWTKVNLKKVKKTLFKDALNCAYLRISKPLKD